MKLSDEEKEKIIKILKRYPNKVPLYVEKGKSSKLKDLPKKKYLLPSNMTLGDFMIYIRKQIKLSPNEALFLFINGKLEVNSLKISEIYHREKDENCILHIIYDTENTFGYFD